MTASIHVHAEPVSIPLSIQDPEQQRRNEELLLNSTGFTVEQIKVLSDTKGLPLRRLGNGKGTRWLLYLADFRRWCERLPQA